MQNFDEERRFEKISVFLADRTAFFRQGASAALNQYPDIEVVGEFDIDEGALELIQAVNTQVVLMDITPPHYSGIKLTRQLTQSTRNIAVAMLTPYPDEDELVMATTAGAAAYFSRYIESHELVDTIRQMADGMLPIVNNLIAKPSVLQRVLGNFQGLSSKGMSIDSSHAPITERETEILSYAARGFGNKQIAAALGISEQTIKNHMTSILRKLDANDRTQAVVMAMQSGWISTATKSNRTN